MVFGAGGVVQGGGVGAAAVAAEFRGVAVSGDADAVGVETVGVDAFADGVVLGGVDVIGDAIDAVDLGCSGCSTKTFSFKCDEAVR